MLNPEAKAFQPSSFIRTSVGVVPPMVGQAGVPRSLTQEPYLVSPPYPGMSHASLPQQSTRPGAQTHGPGEIRYPVVPSSAQPMASHHSTLPAMFDPQHKPLVNTGVGAVCFSIVHNFCIAATDNNRKLKRSLYLYSVLCLILRSLLVDKTDTRRVVI